MNLKSLEVRMYKLILENKHETVFPNILVVLTIYFSLMTSNCPGEMSDSILRSETNECSEHDILHKLDLSSLINDFMLIKCRQAEFLQSILTRVLNIEIQ